MALPAPLQTLYDRLKTFYNGSAYNSSSNPGGFARGGNQAGNFIAAMRDYADFGKGIADIGADVQANADAFEDALAAIQAGPVSSVVGRSGAVTAAHIATAIGFDAAQETAQNNAITAVGNRATALENRAGALEDYRSPFTFAYAFR